MEKLDKGTVSKFEYHYRFEITDDQLLGKDLSRNKKTNPEISITYFKDSNRREVLKGKYKEKISSFHRKLIFNLLSKVLVDESKIEFNAKYYYIIFHKGNFLFCMDSVVCSDGDPIVVPAQYLYVTHESKSSIDTSTIEEYIGNLRKIWNILHPKSENPFRKNTNWPFISGSIEDKFEIEKTIDRVIFSGTGNLRRHPLGEFSGLVPIPKFGDPLTIPKHGIIVGTLSNNQQTQSVHRRLTKSVRSSLEELTRILWGDSGLTTWIMGQPGTGKEVFAQALHHGLGRVQDYKTLKLQGNKQKDFEFAVESMRLENGFSIQSVAGVTLQEFSNRIFTGSKDTNGYCLVELIDKLNGTIFLDEFDKPENHFLLYSALLRVLEAKQYIKRTYDEDNNRMSEMPSTFEKVNWIFAGAFTQIDPRKHVPFDLWSRLKGFIHLRNPLEDDDDPDYGATLFLYWYLKLVSGVLNERGDLVPIMEAITKDPDQRNYREHIACMLLGQHKKILKYSSFLPSAELRDFASHFQRLLNRKTTFSGDRLDSPRGIFKATESAFNFLREKAFYGENFPLSVEAIRDDALTEAHKSLRLSRGPS